MSVNGKHPNEIAVVYANGVLRPEQPLAFAEKTRLHVAIRRIDVTPEQEARGRAAIREIQSRGGLRLSGWRPTRDELHERN